MNSLSIKGGGIDIIEIVGHSRAETELLYSGGCDGIGMRGGGLELEPPDETKESADGVEGGAGGIKRMSGVVAGGSSPWYPLSSRGVSCGTARVAPPCLVVGPGDR